MVHHRLMAFYIQLPLFWMKMSALGRGMRIAWAWLTVLYHYNIYIYIFYYVIISYYYFIIYVYIYIYITIKSNFNNRNCCDHQCCKWEPRVGGWGMNSYSSQGYYSKDHPQYANFLTSQYNKYIYIYRLKAGGSPELRGTRSLDAIPERSFLYTGRWGGWGGVITSCEVRWMMLNPGRCCLVGRMLLRCKFRCCLQKGGWGVGGGVITSCEVRWMMLNPGRCCLVGRCCYVASFVVVYRRGVGGWGGVITSCEVRWMMLNPGRCCLVGRCCYVASFEWLACSTHLLP